MISNNINEKWGQRKNQNKPGGGSVHTIRVKSLYANCSNLDPIILRSEKRELLSFGNVTDILKEKK